MNTYFSSDTHYNHSNIIKYSNRPFSSVEEMNEHMIQEHNKLVKPTDEFFHMGDFAFANDDKTIEIIKRLNGKKTLILGNHDVAIIKHPEKFTGPKLFEEICTYKEINRGVKICLFHYGQRAWNGSYKNPRSYMLYGHSHGTLPPLGTSVDVGVDAKFINDEYRPVSLDEVHDFMKKQPFNNEDYLGVKND